MNRLLFSAKLVGFSGAFFLYLALIHLFGGEFGVVHVQTVWLASLARAGFGFKSLRGQTSPFAGGIQQLGGRVFWSYGLYMGYCWLFGQPLHALLFCAPLIGIASAYLYHAHTGGRVGGVVGLALVPISLLSLSGLQLQLFDKYSFDGFFFICWAVLFMLLAIGLFAPDRDYWHEVVYLAIPVSFVGVVESTGHASKSFFYAFKIGDVLSQFYTFIASFGRREVAARGVFYAGSLLVSVLFALLFLRLESGIFLGLSSAVVIFLFYFGSYALVLRGNPLHLYVCLAGQSALTLSLMFSNVYSAYASVFMTASLVVGMSTWGAASLRPTGSARR